MKDTSNWEPKRANSNRYQGEVNVFEIYECESNRETGPVMKHYINYKQQSLNDVGVGGYTTGQKMLSSDMPC